MIPVGVVGSGKRNSPSYSAYSGDLTNHNTQTWSSDPEYYTLGQRFQFSVPGKVTHLGFRKGNPDPTTTRKLYFWNEVTSTLLATVISTGESGTGWVFVAVPTPISVIANNNYLLGWQRPINSSYRALTNYSWPSSNGPISAVSSGTYTTGNADPPAMPVQQYQTSNYFGDLIFIPN